MVLESWKWGPRLLGLLVCNGDGYYQPIAYSV
jgi:hypothetical protein